MNNFCPNCNKINIIFKKEENKNLCPCNKEKTKEEIYPKSNNKCTRITKTIYDHLSYLRELSNQKDKMKYPCNPRLELKPEHRIFIDEDYPP